MSSQLFLWISLMLGTGFLGLFFLGFSLGDRGVLKPSRLNLKRNYNKPLSVKYTPSPKQTHYSSYPYHQASTQPKSQPYTQQQQAYQGATISKEAAAEAAKYQADFKNTKNLNIMFMYNGHDWDAYQVLGIPAGSKIEAVRRAYLMALDSADPASHDFLQAAVSAIEEDYKQVA